jgi:beta-galactosidase
MVHIVPMDWTSWAPGQAVSVWVYANVPTVELGLNGRSLGTKSFDRKVTSFGRTYLETTEQAHDDYNYPSGSYTSPNGSTGKLHLTWDVPFSPGRLEAIGFSGGVEVARDTLVTAGPPRALTLTPDARVLAADGMSVGFVTVSVVDGRGVLAPNAGSVITFTVSGPGTLAGTDNGRQESAPGYKSPVMAAFNGRAVALVRAGRQPGTVRLTATSPGLAAASVTFQAVAPRRAAASVAGARGASGMAASGPGAAGPGSPAAAGGAPSGSAPTPDASYSGAPTTVPAMMLDGSLSTGWSNYYNKAQTANLRAVSVSNASDWVSLSWASPQRLGEVKATFTTGGALALPASIAVAYWNGRELAPVRNLKVTWAAESNQPTTLTFDPVVTSQVRLTMSSPNPGTGAGFLRIAELQAVTS